MGRCRSPVRRTPLSVLRCRHASGRDYVLLEEACFRCALGTADNRSRAVHHARQEPHHHRSVVVGHLLLGDAVVGKHHALGMSDPDDCQVFIGSLSFAQRSDGPALGSIGVDEIRGFLVRCAWSSGSVGVRWWLPTYASHGGRLDPTRIVQDARSGFAGGGLRFTGMTTAPQGFICNFA